MAAALLFPRLAPNKRISRCFALWLVICGLCLATALPARPCRAACPAAKAVLYMPFPEGSQPDMLYLPLVQAWGAGGAHSMTVERAPGRGGSYALSRLVLDKRLECALAAVQIPSFDFLTRAPNRMVRAEEIAPLGVFAYAPHALWVSEHSSFRNVRDLADFALATKQGSPRLVIAGTGSYTDHHLATLALDRTLGVKSIYYPISGSNEAPALMENNIIHACWGYALPGQSMPGMRPLAVAAKERSAALPDTPTFAEQDIDAVGGSHFGLAMAANVPEDTRAELADRLIALMAAPALRKLYAESGISPLSLVGNDLKDFLARHAEEAEKLLREYPLLPHQILGK